MILGVGTDLANIDRIAGVLERHSDRFLNRVFTEEQRKPAQRCRWHLCKRWLLKRPVPKPFAQDCAWASVGKTWPLLTQNGQPVMTVTGWAAERLKEMTPEGHEATIHVSLTDDHPWAQAFVVIEAQPIA